ncbi:K02A2.6-like, partial [Cordylochernes scorpioides]
MVSFVYAVRREPTLGSRKIRWKSPVRVNDTSIHFKLDPGSDVTLLPFSLFKRYFSNVQLTPTDGQLMAAANQRLENDGTFVAKLRANTREMKDTVYVVHHLEQPLLGVGACEDLQLVRRIDLVINGTTDVNPEREFPKLFERLGLLEQPYHIKLKEGAKPFSIPVPRRVPLPLMPKLKEQLDAMVAQEVIEPVDEPTECAPEHFQKGISAILRGVNGVICHMDDILIFAKRKEEHDETLREVLRRLKNSGITLNKEKCQFGASNVTFLGHYIDEHGIKADEKKVKAIAEMKPPADLHGVQRFMGMVNFQGRFFPNLAEITKPLNDLRKKDVSFIWGSPQKKAFEKVKDVLASDRVLASFDISKKTMFSADASSYGLGAVLKQEHEANEWRPVAFASRTVTKTEQGYAQIEKEALAITWACERFKDFVVGKTFLIETDHKPLVPIFTTEDLNDLTPRLQRRQTCQNSPQPEAGAYPSKCGILFQKRLARQMSALSLLDSSFYDVRDEIGEENGLLMRGLRVIIPSNMRKYVLNRIHASHQGITKCRARAKDHVWWPGIGQEIQDMVKTCEKCIENQPLKHEPLIPNDFPERPWQKVGMDLFHYEGSEYLVVVDYFSRFIEVVRLTKLSSETVVDHCKAIFAHHGIPDIVISDNEPQFHPSTTSAFTKFAFEVGFRHITSSPKHPQSNGQAEAAVKIVKNLMKKNKDPVLALMEYRATPLANGLSPAELLFGRKIRTMVLCTSPSLTPKTVDQSKLRGGREQRKMAQKTAFDRRHAATKKAELIAGEKRADRMDEKNETQNAEEYTAEGENNPAVSTPKIEPPPPSAELPAVLARLAACLSALQTTSDRVTHRTEIEVQSFDGTYPAAQFFRTYDQKTDWDGLTNTEKVLRLPRYLNNKPLEHFRRLRMETQHYIQVRQTFLDLYPETNEATYAQYFSMKLAGQPNLEEYYRNKTALGLQLGLPQEVILETLTEGLPPSDQRLVRIVPPENLGAWFRLVQRIRGSGAPSPRHPDEHAPPLLGPYAPVRPSPRTVPTRSTPPTDCRFCGGLHWHSECRLRQAPQLPRASGDARAARSAQLAEQRPRAQPHHQASRAQATGITKGAPDQQPTVNLQTIDGHVPTIGQITFPLSIHAITQNEVFHVVDAPLPFGILGINTLRKFKLKIDFAHGTMYQLDAPLSPLTYHFAVLPERCTYWECQADLCKAHTIFPPSANNTQYAHFSDNTSTTQGLTQPPHHVQSKNFFRANCSYYRVKVPEQPPNANLSHPTKVQTDHLHHTPKHPHSTHHSMYHTHHPLSPEHLPGIPIDNQPQPPYPPQFPALLRQYQHVFSRNKFAVPCLKVPPVRIATNSDKVVTIRPYRVPICDQREIRSQIRQMLDNDIIEPSYSPFSSPVTLVTKRDKTKRFCIDYRKVNEVISSDVHPLPRIEDILDRLARAKYFSTADVSSAYWQVPIHPDSRPLLAFATIDGLYQPTRLPFGLKTSPQIYERAINQVLQGHGLDCVAHYFDDFVIYSETLEEHQEHLRKFFAFCDAENLQLNLTKCEFFRQTIEFLGYTITAGTTTPLIRNTDVIHAIPPPNNRKTLQSFLGAVNVYNKFIPDYARLRTPLNNLLKKDVTWDWDDKCQKAFTSLKESLTQHPVLHLYKDELPCQVYCDASTLGIAGVLKQVHSAGKAYPVQYFSRALRVHERNYTISELECLAIVESVEKFRVYLMGRKFTIFSDHHALQWLKTIKNPSGRLFRWSLRLSCYEYEVRYIKGALQHEADLLSRNPFCGFLDATLLKNHQLTPSGESKLTIDRNGLQTLKRRGVTKIVVPDALVPDLLTKVHSRYNHPGISQMTRLISPQYYWKGMSEDISKTTKACAICQSTKPPRGPTFGELGQLPVATQPFDLVALDTIAGLAKYGNAKAYLHVVVDHFSRYTWTFPSKSTSITTYQQVIKRVLQDGSPKRLLTDRAPAFTSPKFRKFLINRNIHPLLTTSNNPQANGLCERLNATLTGKLRLLHLENPKAAWTKLAKRVTVVYNNTPHSVTGFPPGYLMFGVLPPELTEHVNPYPVLTTARRIAHERTQAKHLKDKHAYDQQHKTPHFEPGDLVLVKVYHHPNTGKLAPYFTGPYEILEIISPNVVRINRPNQPLNRNTDTVHVNKLQYYNENIRYIAPPTLIPHPAKPQSRTLPPLFEHLTPDLFTVERFAPTIGNCTTTTPVDPQCNIIAQRDIPQPAISRPTHITKVKTPIPTVRADPKPIPLQA